MPGAISRESSRVKGYSGIIVALAVVLGLSYSFWLSPGWMELCAGLALFLFGMQCLEDGLRQVAGGRLEQLLGRSTATPFKGMLFGVGATMLLQSSTLVSLLTIAFISTGLIQLAGGIAILFGANLGATSGIWLLAIAGQNLSLSPLALPLLVFGILAGFFGAKSKAGGRVLLGIAFLFLGIDQIKDGFSTFSDGVDLTRYHVDGVLGQLLFAAIGLLLTIVLQSSHATLMLTLAALASGQVELGQSLSIAIGSNVGSSVSTAVVGMLGGNRSGQRLALAHVLFNSLTALLALILLWPMEWLVHALVAPFGMQDNALIQLALFHTLFNAFGVLLFWPWQVQLAGLLTRLLPDVQEPKVLITELSQVGHDSERVHARYLNESALASADTAACAVVQELQHLGRLSLEVISHALFLPVDQLSKGKVDEALLRAAPDKHALEADALYQKHIKGVYGDLLSFMGRLEVNLDEQHQQFWVSCQLAALQLVDAVKDAKHLQKNLGHYLREEPSATREAYVDLRRHLSSILHEIRELGQLELPEELWSERLAQLDARAASFDAAFRSRLFASLREQRLDGLRTGSLMNDLGYTSRIIQSLRNVLLLSQGEGHEMFRELRRLMPDELLITLP